MVSFLVVAAPHLIPCPVDPRLLAESADPTGENRRRRRRRLPEEEASGDVMSEQRLRQRQIEERLAPKRECPVPKPGGLIGQVLGMKENERDVEEEQLSILKRVERAICKPQSRSRSDDQ